MQALLEAYSVSEVAIFFCLAAAAIKGIVSGYDWAKARLKKLFDADYAEEEHDKEVDKKLKEMEKFYQEKEVVDKYFEDTKKSISETNTRVDNLVEAINRRMDMLVESDKEAIKAYITEQHHRFCYDVGWIDDYNIECLERRFAVYEEEHGNSFVGGLMNEIRDLPRRPPENDNNDVKEKIKNTSRYVKGKAK